MPTNSNWKNYLEAHEGYILSEGTLVPEDLLDVFVGFIVDEAQEGQALSDELLDDYHEESLFSWENYSWALEECYDILNELAPEGYYFGTMEGDGACFGFFKEEQDAFLI